MKRKMPGNSQLGWMVLVLVIVSSEPVWGQFRAPHRGSSRPETMRQAPHRSTMTPQSGPTPMGATPMGSPSANATRSAAAGQHGGGVSQDLLELYSLTHQAKTIEEFDTIVQGCQNAVRDPRRSVADQNYARDLLSWGANRRGEALSDQAADAVAAEQFEEASRLDSQALVDFELSLQHDPKRWRARHNLAIALAMQKRHREAIDAFTQVIQQNPQYPNAYFNRGELYFLLRQYPQAVDDFSAALKLTPRDAAALSSRAHARFLLGDYDEAIQDYRQASAIEPDNLEWLVDLADAHQSLNQWKQAIEIYTEVIERDASQERALQNAAWLFATCPDETHRDGQGALEIANRMMEIAPEKTYRHWDVLAVAQATMGDFTAAVRSIEKGLAVAPAEEKSEMESRRLRFKKKRIYLQEVIEPMPPTTPTNGKTVRTASQPVGTGIRKP